LAVGEGLRRRIRVTRDNPAAIGMRVFTKGIDRESARAQIQIEIEGDRDLEEKVLQLTVIVA
jgi:hypothetical protein